MSYLPHRSFILDAVTLRGVGSYLHGARLEIRPITILCGINGSGKSTWLRALEMLRESHRKGLLPYQFDVSDWATSGLQLLNVFFHSADPDEHVQLTSAEDEAYGPPGTIGLEIIVTSTPSWPNGLGKLGDTLSIDRNCVAQRTFWDLDFYPGARVQIRFSHPSYWLDSQETPHLYELIELKVDDVLCVRFSSPRDPLQTFDETTKRTRRSKPYEVYCSPAMLPGYGSYEFDPIPVGHITDLPHMVTSSVLPDVDADMVRAICQQTEGLISACVDALDGYFYIGALREPKEMADQWHRSRRTGGWSSLRRTKRRHSLFDWGDARRRSVGRRGENTWQRESEYAAFPMLPASVSRIRPQNILDASSILCSFSPTYMEKDERIRAVWQAMSEEARCQMKTMFDCEVSGSRFANEPRQSLAEALESAIDNEEFNDKSAWYELECDHDGQPCGAHPLDARIEILGSSNDREDRRRLRRVLIESALVHAQWARLLDEAGGDEIDAQTAYVDNNMQCPLSSYHYSLDSYVDYWCQKLLQVSIVVRSPELNLDARRWELKPIRDLCNADDSLVGMLADREVDRNIPAESNISKFINPYFGTTLGSPQPPQRMSAGFHQLAPIIVQLGLMQGGEILAIENPEVHLHPTLQLSSTEMLIEHAKTGRRIVVETHSDLVVRRVMRAILAEDIPQHAARIYFVGKGEHVTAGIDSNSKNTVSYSTLEPVHINALGQIDNWPEGFLDEDINESQRLMDVVYGNFRRADEEE